MAHPLDGARAKIERANENIKNLNVEIDTLLNSNLYRIIPERDDDAGKQSFRFTGPPSVPLRISVLVGEIVHHLRSVLDHLVWQLVIRGGGSPGTHHEFPICRILEKYKKAIGRRKIEGVSATAAAHIESLQPYHRGPAYATSPLWIVHDLDITDKHRLLVMVVASVSVERLSVIEGKPEHVTIDKWPSTTRATVPGAEVISLTIQPSGFGVKVKGEFRAQIAFDKFGIAQDQPVIPSLKQLSGSIADTIELFACEFS